MAEDSDLEKTEQPSPRRLEQAREEGQVPQSRELSTFLVLITGVSALWLMGGWVSGRILGLMRMGFAIERERFFDTKLMLGSFGDLVTGALLTMLPLFGILMVAAIAAPILMGGFVFAPKMLGLKLERMNPIQGIGRMFSLHGLAELVKSLLKAAVVGAMGVFAVWREHEHIFGLMGETVEAAVPDFLEMVLFATLLIIMGLAILALIDVPFQLWQYNKKLRMTKGELTLPRHYIYCSRRAPDDRFRPFYERAKTEGWGAYEIDASHNPHITAPDVLADLLHRIAES